MKRLMSGNKEYDAHLLSMAVGA
jgi:hypothetical protein